MRRDVNIYLSSEIVSFVSIFSFFYVRLYTTARLNELHAVDKKCILYDTAVDKI